MTESTRETVATPAISKGYNFASTWEQNARLTEEQQALVAVLSQTIADTLMSSHLTEESVKLEETNSTAPRSEMHTAIDVVLLNSHQFYKWHADLEPAMKSDTEEKYRQYVNTLTGHLQTCESILNQVDNTLGLFDHLRMQHQAVAIKTSTLDDACERLVMEKDKLVEFADALRSKLNYFDELENITTQFYAATMNVANINFLPLLKRLDECIAYVGNNPQHADSGVSLIKFKQLQSRALGMVCNQVLTILKGASAQVQAAIKEALGVTGKTSISEVAETSVLYVRFKAAASELKPLMEEMGNRSTKKEYADMLADCHSLYCEQRLSLVQGVIQQRISEYARKEPLHSFARLGCAYLIKVCRTEHRLFDHFFPASSSTELLNLAPLTDPLCTCLYDALRPKFIHEADLDLLCELIDILKGEVLDEQPSRHPELLVCLRPTILRTLADVQEQLIFRAQTYMRREVANYLPTQEDIDYPQKLEQVSTSDDNEEEHEGKDIYDVQYPPLEKTLACLAKLYRCVEPAIFTGLAQESIGVCSVSIQRASKLINKKASPMDGQLFLIIHLLILLEQIAPFDIDFAVTHKELDFAHLLEHLWRIVRGQTSLFDFTSRTSLARTLSPRVLESQVDAKKELEKNLKITCEQFIMSVTKLIVEPMLSFMTKVTAVKVTKASSLHVDGTKSLKDQAFAAPEKVAEMVSKVDVALKEELPTVVLKMKLYLRNPSTWGILFKPIKSNILEAHEQVLAVINTEYSIENVNMIHARDQPSLQEYLDSLS